MDVILLLNISLLYIPVSEYARRRHAEAVLELPRSQHPLVLDGRCERVPSTSQRRVQTGYHQGAPRSPYFYSQCCGGQQSYQGSSVRYVETFYKLKSNSMLAFVGYNFLDFTPVWPRLQLYIHAEQQVLKKWTDNEQSSNSSQADSSEESAPNTEETGEKSPEEVESERQVVESGQALLDQWNSLKEVFKIPKKDKKETKPSYSSTRKKRLRSFDFLFVFVR